MFFTQFSLSPPVLSALSDWLSSVYRAFYQAFIAADRYMLYLQGIGVTLQITLVAILLGTVLGVLTAFMRISSLKPLRFISSVYVEVIRGTPVVVQLLMMYMVIFSAPGTSKHFVACMTFGINSGAYIAEIVRAGINAVDSGQMEAGRSLGLSKTKTMIFIILPQAVKNILPTYTNEFIVLIKETAVVGYIGLEDLTKISSIITSRTYEAFAPLLIIAIIYFCLTRVLSFLFGKMERRLAVSDRG